MTTIMICEKPDAAKKISAALADGHVKKIISTEGVAYYEFNINKKKHIAVAAVGHLFGLKDVSGKGWKYPIYDLDWAPTYLINKKAEFTKKYYDTIMSVAKDADDFIISTDLDEEGSVIGYNILRFVFKKEKAKRMMFSTLTKEDLVKAYADVQKNLDTERIEAGLTRHYLDFLWGVNVTRALTLSIKNHGKTLSHYLLSAGRVQTPMLYFLIKREKEIKKFVPVPFWELSATVKTSPELLCSHKTSKFWKKEEAEKAYSNSKNKKAVVKTITKREVSKEPPKPFDLTSLQTEAYRFFGYSPKRTSDIAQKLYTAGYISYPRTSSQKLPPQIGYKEILSSLANMKAYMKTANLILSFEKIIPKEGEKKDPAHPAVYPTKETPDPAKLRPEEKKLYDLIVKRFLAVFGEPSIRESTKVTFDIGGEEFSASGSKTIKANWMDFYKPYSKLEEVEFPKLEEKDSFDVSKVESVGKETQPPSRYSQGSIVRELEEHNLGTKATRANILQTLYNRGYIDGRSIRVTRLGMRVGEILAENVPELISEELTRDFETEMEKVEQGKAKKETVIKKAAEVIEKIAKDFQKNEKAIGENLEQTILKTQEEQSLLGPCLKCGEKHGGELKILYSPLSKKKFVGCTSYARCAKCNFTKKACKCICKICGKAKGKCECPWKEKVWMPLCENIYPLPGGALIQKQDKVCEHCNTPIVRIIRRGLRPFNMCLDPKCKTKENWGKPKDKKKKAGKKAKEIATVLKSAAKPKLKTKAQPKEKKPKIKKAPSKKKKAVSKKKTSEKI